jgi:hypothetical protein
VKSLTLLWQLVLDELGTLCHTSTIHDYKTAMNRSKHEGSSFYTITLPAFGSDFQKSLDEERVDPTLFTGFRFRGGLPLFLGGFLDRVFDRGTGRLLDEPCIDSIYAIRQLTLMFSKILLPCSDRREQAAIQQYIKCEQEIRISEQNTPRELLSEFKRMSLMLFGDVLSNLDKDVYEGAIIPKHGPGATADRTRGNAKYDQQEWPERFDEYFPYGEFAIPNWRYRYLLDQTVFLEPGAERPVRVITVPKTLKTPRIIAIEPTCMQYAQQGIMEMLVDYITHDRIVGNIVGFDDQENNHLLAQKGSLTGAFATLDLSEASDRVSNQHVRLMLSNHPHLLGAVDACRSRKADVNGKTIRLSKFASMGSALTFPIEAMVFTTLVFVGIQRALNRPLTRNHLYQLRDKVRVYGDDLIIPKDSVYSVIEVLEAFGSRVNIDKSFWNGKFRESCGREYYSGEDVSIVRCRRMLPTSRRDVPEVISLVSMRNQFYFAGLWRVASELDRVIVGLLKHFPTVHPSSPLLGRHTLLEYETTRMDSDTHSPLVKGYCVKSKPPVSIASGEGALLKWFLKRGEEPIADRNHLERFGRPDAVDIKLRWTQPF